jgi:hypothetical protein
MANESTPATAIPAATEPPLMPLGTFLQHGVPLQRQVVEVEIVYASNYRRWALKYPSVYLYCDSKICDDIRIFDPRDKSVMLDGDNIAAPYSVKVYLEYSCRHCRVTEKTYALFLETPGEESRALTAMKYGELPPAIGPTPRALQDLLGEQWSMYLQGRRSELVGLGVGAFVYYRRAVEHIWQRVLDRLIDVAKLEAAPERLAALNAAKQEGKFTRSMEAAKNAIPTSLYADGHNPFQALYDACGDGVHEYSDEECIRRSRMIRLVLSRFAERAKVVLGEDREYRAALAGLASGNDGEGTKPT